MRKAEVNDVRCRLSGKNRSQCQVPAHDAQAAPAGCSANAGHQSDPSEQYGGRVKFSLKQLLRLANLFDCQLECFFDPRQAANVAVGGTGQDKRYTQSDMELLLTLVKKSGQP